MIGVVGGRTYKDKQRLYNFLDEVFRKYPDAILVSGGCVYGVDQMVYDYAISRGKDIVVCGAGFPVHGVSGYHLRNGRIVLYSDIIVAFWDGKSAGTNSTITQATTAGVKVHIENY